MTFPATKNDHRELKHILEKGFHDKPNYSHWVYKNRGGISDCVIWTYMDLGNMREKCLFVTDNYFNLIDIDQTTINFEDIHFKTKDETCEIIEEEISEKNIDLDNLDF